MPFALTTAVLIALLLSGCDSGEDDTGPTGTDIDRDGWTVAEGDCDDGDRTVHPGAVEVVADGVDQDCDGSEICYEDGDGDGHGRRWTVASPDLDCSDAGESAVATDCDDTDAATWPGAPESCHDGGDNDCDGLLDCEDGDCATDPTCGEDCGQHGDEDDDGLADCEDDECWGPACHPAGVRARVLSGAFADAFDSNGRWAEDWRFTDVTGCEHCISRKIVVERNEYLRSIQGTVQVLPPSVPSWGATPSRTTCVWSVASVSFTYQGSALQNDCSHGHGWSGGYRSSAAVSGPFRVGLHVDPGCRLAATSWFLPEQLAPNCGGRGVGTVVYNMPDDGCWAADLGPLWYAGIRIKKTSVRTTVYKTTPGTSSCPETDLSRVRDIHRTYTGVLDPGSVYTALP